jgi:AP-3 complex subunit mu
MLIEWVFIYFCFIDLQVQFKVPKETISGLRIENVNIVNEKYKPYKGMRSLTKAGNFEIRC